MTTKTYTQKIINRAKREERERIEKEEKGGRMAEKKIGFMELSFWMKLAVIGGLFAIIDYTIIFVSSFFSGLS